MIPKPFDQVTKDDIDSLIVNQVKESRVIEYKESLPTNQDKDKREFLYDVCSFANAAGGDLLYGIVEKRDSDGKPTGIPESALGLSVNNASAEVLRLESIMQSGIGPRITGIKPRLIDGFTQGPVLVMRIPKSYAAPHMVTFQDSCRFYSRNNGGKYIMDVDEIRNAFLLSESVPERVRRFQHERLAKLVLAKPRAVLHICPLAAFSSAPTLDLASIAANSGLPLMSFRPSGRDYRFNLDGILSTGGSDDRPAHALFFRNGIAEFVTGFPTQAGVPQLPVTQVEKMMMGAVESYVKLVTELGVVPPLVILASLVFVHGLEIWFPNLLDRQPPIDRTNVILPDVVLTDYKEKLAAVLRPAFDAMWQSAGWPRSMNYDENGVWAERC